MSQVFIRYGRLEDWSQIKRLYSVVAHQADGIIRHPAEITNTYVRGFIEQSLQDGLLLVAELGGTLVGEIHAYRPQLYAFQHILRDLTIVVDPDQQGKGIGKKLFVAFLEQVERNYSHILRVELYVREHNERNLGFYERLGFRNEGRQENKIYLGDGQFHTPLHMAWINPNYRAGR